MGYPSIYYKRALQCFAHALVCMEDKKISKRIIRREVRIKVRDIYSGKEENM